MALNKKYLLIILAFSLLTRFLFFGYPAETVFDEVHFGKFISGYLTGEYFFDIHPPLGKLLIAAMAKAADFKPGFSFETIGQSYPDNSYQWLRFLPKLAGAFLPVVIFLLALELGISQRFSFLAGILAVFENALLTQSRFILLDSFLLLFGFLAILFFLKFGKSLSNRHLFLAGLFGALAASIKWTGFSFLGLILILFFSQTFQKSIQTPSSKFIKGAAFLIAIPFLIYFSVFAVHFLLLDTPGPGNAFHPADFGNYNIFRKFAELNLRIYESNASLNASHPYSSQWFTWPFMIRPIFYWDGPSFTEAASFAEVATEAESEGMAARIYLLGNPAIWWLTTGALFYSIASFITKNQQFRNSQYSFMLFGYLINLIPFAFIGRVMFLYHYFPALIFAILILCFYLDKIKKQKTAFWAILLSSAVLFLFFSPLSYGLEIPEQYYNFTLWLPTWR